ncbi:MAG TPA: flagellin, partial [Bryobacteraceae bacterium]|nr:flagellin [Bryobacteraceae bacterium]
ELTQGVNNANNGVSQLQIVDGGLSNISTILDRMKTLATESASGTFTGDRGTLNSEYQGLIQEITRQATNINLNTGGSFNSNLNVYIGGASSAANAGVSINLSGSQNAVDASSLGLSTTNVLGGGVGISGNSLRIDAPGATFAAQTFTFNVYANGASTQVTATSTAGSQTTALASLNSTLGQYGITAGVNGNGLLQFSGSTAFTVSAAAGGLTTAAGTAENTSNYTIDGGTGTNKFVAPTGTQTDTLNFQTTSGQASVTLDKTITTVTAAAAAINAQTAKLGVYAVVNSAGDGLSFQSANSFSLADTTSAAAIGVFGAGAAAGTTNNTSTAPAVGNSTNATSAIAAINAAIQQLGLTQGAVGAGENKLQYAISLAQSQITNFSSAESQIKDANVAADASNLTKSQVLVQTSIAAMAQANNEPQAVLKLLQG